MSIEVKNIFTLYQVQNHSIYKLNKPVNSAVQNEGIIFVVFNFFFFLPEGVEFVAQVDESVLDSPPHSARVHIHY